jgi:hypothetical protein
LSESGKVGIDFGLKERVPGRCGLFLGENGRIFAVLVCIFSKVSIHVCLWVHVWVSAWGYTRVSNWVSMGVSLLLIIYDCALQETASVI